MTTISSSISLGVFGFLIIIFSFVANQSMAAFYSLALLPSSIYFARQIYESGFRANNKAEFKNFLYHLALLLVCIASILAARRAIDIYNGRLVYCQPINAWLSLFPIYLGLLFFVRYDQTSSHHVFAFYTMAIYAILALFMTPFDRCKLFETHVGCLMVESSNQIWDERSTTLILFSYLSEYVFMLVLFSVTFAVFATLNFMRRRQIPRLNHFKLSKWARRFLLLHLLILGVGHFSTKFLMVDFPEFIVRKFKSSKVNAPDPVETVFSISPSPTVPPKTLTPTPEPWPEEKLAELRGWFDKLGTELSELPTEMLEYANATGSCWFTSKNNKGHAYFNYPNLTINFLDKPLVLKAMDDYKRDLNIELGDKTRIYGFSNDHIQNFTIEAICSEDESSQYAGSEYAREDTCTVVIILNNISKNLGKYACISGD